MDNTQPERVDVRIADVRLDASETQVRIAINDEVVDEYVQLLTSMPGEWPFPPIIVFRDESSSAARPTYWMSSGWHRTFAARAAGRESVPGIVREGTSHDAFCAGIAANAGHGLRMSRADRRHCVEVLLRSEAHTYREIAELASVALRTVTRVAADQRLAAADDAVDDADDDDAADDAVDDADDDDAADDAVDDADDDDAADDADDDESEDNDPVAWRRRDAAQIRRLEDAVGRWLPCIDVYRERYPGAAGDTALSAVKSAYSAMQDWRKGIER